MSAASSRPRAQSTPHPPERPGKGAPAWGELCDMGDGEDKVKKIEEQQPGARVGGAGRGRSYHPETHVSGMGPAPSWSGKTTLHSRCMRSLREQRRNRNGGWRHLRNQPGLQEAPEAGPGPGLQQGANATAGNMHRGQEGRCQGWGVRTQGTKGTDPQPATLSRAPPSLTWPHGTGRYGAWTRSGSFFLLPLAGFVHL